MQHGCTAAGSEFIAKEVYFSYTYFKTGGLNMMFVSPVTAQR